MVMLTFGAAGEEVLFRGYGFQVLLRTIGPYATILPVGVLFGALHAANPNVDKLGLINTAGFGVLFGYAFLRSRDLWLPVRPALWLELYTATVRSERQWD